jgi:hypothetical protein
VATTNRIAELGTADLAVKRLDELQAEAISKWFE